MPHPDQVITPGTLMVIGGAEDKLRKRTILKQFVAASGGTEARIALIPTASSLGDEVVEVYDALFRRLGAAEVIPIRPESREDAHDPQLVECLTKATGIFMTGGNQLKLSVIVSGTPLGDAIVEAAERGVVIAGTSAGASIQASHMVAFGVGGTTPKQRMTQVAAGLGLIESCVIDQHFEQRNRYGRLLMIVSQSPSLLGLGVDEDTAAVVRRDERGHEIMTVIGKGAVTVFDPARVVTDSYEAPRSAPMLASGVILHVLPAGSTFDLTDRALVLPDRPAPSTAAAGVQQDMKQAVRDIDAADKSPRLLRQRLARKRTAAQRAALRRQDGAPQ